MSSLWLQVQLRSIRLLPQVQEGGSILVLKNPELHMLKNNQCQWLGNTYIEAEHLAYNTPSGAHSRSDRHGMARYPDGRILSVTLGVPDTFFTIPAHGRLHGKYVSGYVSVDTGANRGEGEYTFTIAAKQGMLAS